MSKSQRLTLQDTRGAFHLVREICELGDDTAAWRAHMLKGICRIANTNMALSYVAPLTLSANQIGATLVVERGVPAEFQRFVQTNDWGPSPATPSIMSRLPRGFTLQRRRLCSDNAWYGSKFFNELLRRTGLDDQLISMVPLPGLQRLDGLGLSRGIDDPPFGERERKIVALLHGELALLWRTPPLSSGDPRSDLPRQLREVLGHVTAGMTERQTAIRMGLSQHTVHSYLKVLHRRFGATSRVELVERTRPRRPALRPRLEAT
jgi:hypothetical protein